jgi:hypothetical protein
MDLGDEHTELMRIERIIRVPEITGGRAMHQFAYSQHCAKFSNPARGTRKPIYFKAITSPWSV